MICLSNFKAPKLYANLNRFKLYLTNFIVSPLKDYIMKTSTTLYLIFFTNLLCYSQNVIQIPLKTVIGIDNVGIYTIPYTLQKDSIANYKGIPTNLKNHKIGHIIFQRSQYLYWKYQNKNLDKKGLIERLGNTIEDTLSLSLNHVKCYVTILVGLRGNKKIIIIDTNNNDNFSDEVAMEYDLNNILKEYHRDSTLALVPAYKVNYEVFKNNTIHNRVKWLKIVPYDDSYSYNDTLIQKLTVYGIGFDHKEGTFKIKNKNFKIVIANTGGFENNYNFFKTNIQRDSLDFKKFGFIDKGFPFELNGDKFMAESCSMFGDTVTIKYLGFEKDPVGWQLGNRIPPVIKNISISGDTLNSAQLLANNKYLMLDFWGSWCAPCIKSIPHLKQFLNKKEYYKILPISIAYEYNAEGQSKALDYIKKFGIDWTNIIEKKKDNNFSTGFVNSFNVTDYPTVILIDKNGKIVFREVGLDAIEKIERFIK